MLFIKSVNLANLFQQSIRLKQLNSSVFIFNSIQSFSTSTTSTSSRHYFYYVDAHGFLYLYDTQPKNFTTAFKDTRFLDFFYRRLQPLPKEGIVMNFPDTLPNILKDEFRYLSPCAGEMNFIASEDTPIVYKGLDKNDNMLIYAGNLKVPLCPNALHVNKSNGRLYHPAPSILNKKGEKDLKLPLKHDQLALIRSSLIEECFAEVIDFEGLNLIWKENKYKLWTF